MGVKALLRDSRRQVITDLVLWVLLAILVAAMGPDPLHDPAAFAVVTGPRLALTALVVLVGRPWPLAAVVLLLPLGPWDFTDALATSDVTWLDPSAANVKIVPLAPVSLFTVWYAYLTGRRSPPPGGGVTLAGAAAGLTVLGIGLVVARGGTLALWITMVSWLAATYVVPYALGALRRRLIHQREQARQSAEERARLLERARIARDMHDSLGHDLALIAVRAAGLELSPALEPAQAKAAGELRAAAADAIERLRQIIGVLRDDTDPAPLTPAGDSRQDVEELVERARASGMDITLRVEGPVPGPAHAVVQEGLTNAAKHAPGAAVEVAITPRRVVVRNGPPTRPPAVTTTGGLGLAGLRDRVRAAGGALRAASTPDGFELIADLP